MKQKLNLQNEEKHELRRESVFLPCFNEADEGGREKYEERAEEEVQVC